MKILYLVADHGIPVLGRKGCSTHVRETCRGLIEAGHEVTIVTPNRGEDESVDPGAKFILIPRLTQKWLGSDLRKFLCNRRVKRALREYLRDGLPDLIYERYSLYSTAGLALSREFNIPRILEVNAHLVEEQKDRMHFPWIAQRFENHLIGSAERVIVVSQPLKDSFLPLGLTDEQIEVMPMAVDTKRFKPNIGPCAIRDLHGITSKTIAGYVGTLTGWHGIDMMYDVAHRFASEGVDCSLVVIGGDPRQVEGHRERVKQENLEGKLVFLGSIPYEDVPACIGAMDIAVITNSTEFASPTKLFEYQAMGKASVAPSLLPIRQAMDHEVEGLLFEPNSISELTESILRLHADPEMRVAMGLRARERVVKTRSWQINVERIIAMYEKMLDARTDGA